VKVRQAFDDEKFRQIVIEEERAQLARAEAEAKAKGSGNKPAAEEHPETRAAKPTAAPVIRSEAPPHKSIERVVPGLSVERAEPPKPQAPAVADKRVAAAANVELLTPPVPPDEKAIDIGQEPAGDFLLEAEAFEPGEPADAEFVPEERMIGSLVVSQEELLDEIPGLAAFYGEWAEAEAFEQFDYPEGLPLGTLLELSLFNEDSLTEEPEKTSAAIASEYLFEAAETQPDLVALLESLEPEQAEAVQPVLSVIARLARQIQELPDITEDAAGATEKLVMEQALEQWCERLFECFNIEADPEMIRQFAQLMTGSELVASTNEESLATATLTDEGTHEHKATDSLAALSRLAHDIKQKLHLPLWLGRYTLRVAAA